jgi:N-acetylneuraminic acid mutarotase
MAYDTVRGRTVMFGGDSMKPQLFNDTWEWDGALWTQMANFGPRARSDHAMAYDIARKQTVVFGGVGGALVFGDTWGWSGEAWTQLADSGPPKRSGHGASYDSSRQRLVIFGGTSDGTTVLGDTWEWDGSDWTQVSETGPSARKGPAMAFDSGRNKMVVFGGAGVDGIGLGDTWEWNGNTWTRAADFGANPCVNAAMVFESDRSALFGGIASVNASPQPQLFGATWEWDGKHWVLRQDMGPGPRWRHAMAFDSPRSTIVLFGGMNAFAVGADDPTTKVLGDTWEHQAESGSVGGSLSVASLSINPNILRIGQQADVRLTLSGPAASNTTVTISTNAPNAVFINAPQQGSLPYNLSVTAGGTWVTFSVRAQQSNPNVVLNAELNGTSQSVAFSIIPF